MGYSKVNWYLIKNPLVIYLLFLITGVIFFWKFSHLAKAEPDIVVLTDTVSVYVDSSKTHQMYLDDIAQEFIDQPLLQEHAMELYLKYNKKQLSEYIGKHQFTYYRGVYITESGILAAAHLGGAGSVKTFFKGGKIFKDGNGVPITTYMKEFSGYNLEFK
jgi:hypothetical protein